MLSWLTATALSSIALQASLFAVGAYHWPDPQLEYADKLLFGDAFLSQLAVNCAPRDKTTVAAQWLRIAYHDMSTHNVDDGTGGLDASIVYELERPENIGLGMLTSVGEFILFTSPVASLADIIAMGAVMGVAACGGPVVPYRAGRINATVAGPPGVPEPHQDLSSHAESFRRQGFTESEMIALVACGHTLGGVRREDFPGTIHDTSVDLMTFDSTIQFDNLVVTEYLSGTTKNPLVVGPNTTTNSDFRIFSSDGNITMQSIAPPDSFSKTCSSLIERMINTVPKDVILSEVVEPIQYKIGDTRLFPANDGSFTLSTSLRLLSRNEQRKVTLFWNDRQGSVCGDIGCSVQPVSSRAATITYLAHMRGISEGVDYSFSAKINMTSSISKFWFEIDERDGSDVTVVDNGGSGFVIDQDTVLLDLGRSKRLPNTFTSFNLVVAVRGDASAQVFVMTYEPSADTNNVSPKMKTIQLALDTRFPPTAGFTFFSGNASSGMTFFDVHGVVGDDIFTQTFVDASIIIV
ncbi:l-ascorbate oxidase [Moniliophthora roreri MCA 2997]|uniref:Peroxidase n=1 Tax=Moniliophthora roreri (strain MCA 2997) TaxID=1381753 RepID=V2XLR5_MONRO|nr:l-ascorbate oxidase [Moniliophthora roreri MCA 2997]